MLPGSAQDLRSVVIVMPLRDDWQSVAQLLRMIDRAVSDSGSATRLDVVLIDDASVQPCDPTQLRFSSLAIKSLLVLRLRRNLGHQRAIAIGLAWIAEHAICDAVVVMDADGEDTPEGVIILLQAFSANGGRLAVFAERHRRSESLLFRFFYVIYKLVHVVLTGVSVRVGNFSILPAAHLKTLVVVSELWNHYAAAVFRSRLPLTMTPIARGHRIAGKSTMNFVALVTHGLSAISVFSEVVGVRLLIAALVGAGTAAAGIVLVAYIRIFTRIAIPGWATYVSGMLAVIIIQLITIAASFTFFMLSSRNSLGFVGVRDYSLFTAEVIEVFADE